MARTRNQDPATEATRSPTRTPLPTEIPAEEEAESQIAEATLVATAEAALVQSNLIRIGQPRATGRIKDKESAGSTRTPTLATPIHEQPAPNPTQPHASQQAGLQGPSLQNQTLEQVTTAQATPLLQFQVLNLRHTSNRAGTRAETDNSNGRVATRTMIRKDTEMSA